MFSSWTYEIDSELKSNIAKTTYPYCIELVPAFGVRNTNPENIFDNLVGKCAAFHLLKSKILVKDLIYNEYWLNHEDFKNINLSEFHVLDTIHIEFWFKSGLWEKTKINFHLDGDEHRKVLNKNNTDDIIENKPIFTSLIYLSENMNTPTMIVDESNKVGISFPESDKSIVFNGGKYIHGHYPVFFDKPNESRSLIAFNVFLHRVQYSDPLNINQLYQWYYMKQNMIPITLPLDVDIKIYERKIHNIVVNTTPQIFEQSYEDIYNNNINTDTCFKLISKIKNEILVVDPDLQHLSYDISINTNISEGCLIDIGIDNHEKITTIEENNEIENFDRYQSKNFNVFVESGLIDANICKWLIVESELSTQELYGGWKNDRHKQYPTFDIAIDDLSKSCVRLILTIFQNQIANLIYNRFNIDKDDYILDIDDCFVVKYNEDTQKMLEEHTDESDITAIIGLSDIHDYTGGGTEFENGLQVQYNQGDVLIFGSQYRHKGLPITSGTRMILSTFINVKPLLSTMSK
jgi:hypothetical protein